MCSALGLLVGSPIGGALVGHGNHWYKGATFAGVSVGSSFFRHCLIVVFLLARKGHTASLCGTSCVCLPLSFEAKPFMTCKRCIE